MYRTYLPFDIFYCLHKSLKTFLEVLYLLSIQLLKVINLSMSLSKFSFQKMSGDPKNSNKH